MKKIIFDELRRSAWIYGLLGSALALMFSLFPKREIQEVFRASSIIAYALLFAGPLLLSYRLQRGFARVVLSMPVKTTEAGYACWLFSAGIPMIFFAIITAGFFGIQFVRGISISIMPAHFLIYTACVFAYIGTVHFILTFMPSQGEEGFRYSFKNILIGAMWGLSIGGGVALTNSMFTRVSHFQWQHYAALLGGLIMTFVGLLRSENMLIARSSPALGNERENATGEKKAVRMQFGSTGIGFLFQYALRITGQFLLIFFATLLVMNGAFLNGTTGLSLQAVSQAAERLWPMTGFLLIPTFLWLNAVRQWRTLPISTFKMIVMISGLFALPAVLMMLLQTFVGGFLDGGMKTSVLTNALGWIGISLMIPGIVLSSGSSKSFIPLFMILMPVGVIWGGFLSNPIAAACSFVGLGACGMTMTYLALTRSNSPYKVNLFART